MIKKIKNLKLRESIKTHKQLATTAEMQVAIKRLEDAVIALERTTALMEMTERHNPYWPLVRVMCRLELIKDWPT